MAVQEGRRSIYTRSQELEDALVRSAWLQAHVLWEWQRGKAERDNWHPLSQVSMRELGNSIVVSWFMRCPYQVRKHFLWLAFENYRSGFIMIFLFLGRLWTITRKRMLWILWQMREHTRCLQSHRRMPGMLTLLCIGPMCFLQLDQTALPHSACFLLLSFS